MKHLLAALWLLGINVPHISADAAQKHRKSGLSIAIVLPKDNAGTPILNRGGVFQVVFTNHSPKPVRLWQEACQPGYETPTFRVEERKGPSWLMYKVSRHPSDWRNTPPQTITIPAGETFSWRIGPSEIWGELVWKGVPEPNTGKPVKLTAVFEVKPTDAVKERGVWTGRVTSEPVNTLVVDPKLRTPHEYLWAACPKQALRLIQADRTWITRRDEYQHTPLHLAARFGFTDVARWLLSNGADVNATAHNRFTPLHYTSYPEIVKLLIEHKADVNATCVSGTALEKAASSYAHCGRYPEAETQREKWRTITQALLKAGADYDIRSACYLGDEARIRVLLKDKKQARDTEAMRWAATYGQAKIVKLLLDHGADPEDADYGGLTVSYFAIEHAEVLKLLFDAGANPKVVVEYHGNGRGPQGSTLLHEAAGKGLIASAKLLLTRGIDVDVKAKWGGTPLDGACSEGRVKMVEWLLERKAKPSATAMSIAASQVRPQHEEDNRRYQAVVRTLERAGVETDIFAAIACDDVGRVRSILPHDPKCGSKKNAAGRPALHRAVTLDRKQILKLLLDKGCDPDVRSTDKNGYEGETALLGAAFWGRLECAEMLIKHGANVNAKAERGIVPLHEAARMGHLKLAELLLKHGADANAADDKGKTPLDWGWSYGEALEMSQLLRSHAGNRKESK